MAQTRTSPRSKKAVANKQASKKSSTKTAIPTSGASTGRTKPATSGATTRAASKAGTAKSKTAASPKLKPARIVAAPAASDSTHPHTKALLELRAFGLSYPETHLKSPWPEHLDLAVRDKTFAYLSIEGEPLHISCKLPQSCQAALDLEFTEPTGYGLGKSGWVTATFKDSDRPPIEFLKTWIDESYRAQAPKSLSKTLPKMT